MNYTDILISQYQRLPDLWWLWLIVVGVAAGLISWKRRKAVGQCEENAAIAHSIATGLLAAYVLLILLGTLYGKNITNNTPQLVPFWSYGMPSMYVDIIENYLMLVPLGFLAYICFGHELGIKTAFIGALLSISIEVMQLVFSLGYFDIDDIIENTIGCFLGVLIARVIIKHRRNNA